MCRSGCDYPSVPESLSSRHMFIRALIEGIVTRGKAIDLMRRSSRCEQSLLTWPRRPKPRRHFH
jgi:hypothetical protein